MGNKKKSLFDSGMPVEAVQKRLEIPGAQVTRVSDKKLRVTYDRDHFIVDKEKEGYRASVDVPGYLFWVLLLFFAPLWFCVNAFVKTKTGGGLASADGIVTLASQSLGGALVLAFFFYWITAEIYTAVKKKKLARYCQLVSDGKA